MNKKTIALLIGAILLPTSLFAVKPLPPFAGQQSCQNKLEEHVHCKKYDKKQAECNATTINTGKAYHDCFYNQHSQKCRAKPSCKMQVK